jgi:hypothetical protein
MQSKSCSANQKYFLNNYFDLSRKKLSNYNTGILCGLTSQIVKLKNACAYTGRAQLLPAQFLF